MVYHISWEVKKIKTEVYSPPHLNLTSDILVEATAECFRSDKAQTASILDGFKNDISRELIGINE